MPQAQEIANPIEDSLSVPILIFKLGHLRSAFFLDAVVQVYDAVDVGELPEDPPQDVLGLINVRGLKIPLIDIRRRWGLPGGKVQLNNQLIVIESEGVTLSIIVDEVIGTRSVPFNKIVHLEDILPAKSPHMAIADLEGILVLVDADGLFTPKEYLDMMTWVENMIG